MEKPQESDPLRFLLAQQQATVLTWLWASPRQLRSYQKGPKENVANALTGRTGWQSRLAVYAV